MVHMKLKSMAPMAIAAVFAFGACASVSNDPPAWDEDQEVVQAEAGERLVEVSIEEHDITLSTNQVEPGTVVFQVYNNGNVNHDFEIRRIGGEMEDEIRLTLSPDNREDLELDLEAGNYLIVCTVGDHQDTGERARLQVG